MALALTQMVEIVGVFGLLHVFGKAHLLLFLQLLLQLSFKLGVQLIQLHRRLHGGNIGLSALS